MAVPARHDVQQWSAEERAHVARLLDELLDRPTITHQLPRLRRLVVLVTCVGAAVLVPWIAFLAVSLPRSQSVRAWDVVWVGFDISLAACLAFTGWCVVQRRQLSILALTVAATLMVCDAWFDVVLAWDTSGQARAIVSAAFELPVAALMAAAALRILRQTSVIVNQLRGQNHAPDSVWVQRLVMVPPSET